jgi:hypothetical protein
MEPEFNVTMVRLGYGVAVPVPTAKILMLLNKRREQRSITFTCKKFENYPVPVLTNKAGHNATGRRPR